MKRQQYLLDTSIFDRYAEEKAQQEAESPAAAPEGETQTFPPQDEKKDE